MTAPEPTLEHLADLMREAHGRVWTPQGQRQPGSTPADYLEWVEAWQRWQAAHSRKWKRGIR